MSSGVSGVRCVLTECRWGADRAPDGRIGAGQGPLGGFAPCGVARRWARPHPGGRHCLSEGLGVVPGRVRSW